MKVSIKEAREIIRALLREKTKDLMLDKPGTIVEPDVRKKIKAYFKAMGLATDSDAKGKKWS